MARNSQRGFSIVEVIVAIVVVSMLATAFLSAFSSVLKNSVSTLDINIMEGIASSELDRALSGTFQSAVALSGVPATVVVEGNSYSISYTGRSSVSGVTPLISSLHLTVTVETDACISCVSLSGDTFDVQ